MKRGAVLRKPAAAAPSKGGPRRKPIRPDAVIIKVAEGCNYADVLKKVKGEVDPEKAGANVTAVRRTRGGGDVLLEVKGSNGAQALREAVGEVLGEQAKVSTLEPIMTVEIRDLYEVTTDEKVRAALSSALKAPLEVPIKMRVGFRGTQATLCKMLERTAQRLLALGKLKIGWTACRIRERITVDRCHRCQGFGYHAVRCLGIDNANACRSCGENGHEKQECGRTSPRCVVCINSGARADHFSGSGQCRAFKVELEKAELQHSRRTARGVPNSTGVRGAETAGVEARRGRAGKLAGESEGGRGYNGDEQPPGHPHAGGKRGGVCLGENEWLNHLQLLFLALRHAQRLRGLAGWPGGQHPNSRRQDHHCRGLQREVSELGVLKAGRSPEVAAKLQGWRVLEDGTLSDHRCIAMRWLPAKPGKPLGTRLEGGWTVHKLDKEAMVICLREEREEQADNPTDSEVDRLMDILTKACDAGMPRRRPLKAGPPHIGGLRGLHRGSETRRSTGITPATTRTACAETVRWEQAIINALRLCTVDIA
ncbi:uncharacterized protein [Neodiprion pinetum]|uniref:uncharacterized protein n=1 Tax=Neodiprion pinetum TaxID=441929 RepID=UPI0037160BD6